MIMHKRPLALTRRHLLAGSAALSTLILLHPFSARAQANQAHLRIMGTSDLHVHVYPYDYYADRENDTMGLARTAAIVNSIRAEATNAILVDNGDFLQGNPMGDYIAYERGLNDGDVHPVIKAMNALGFDASTLGNHEFNYGLDFLLKALDGAEFPFVCANVTRGALAGNPVQDELYIEPYVILNRELTDGAGETHPIRIGIIGFMRVADYVFLLDMLDIEPEHPVPLIQIRHGRVHSERGECTCWLRFVPLVFCIFPRVGALKMINFDHFGRIKRTDFY